MMKKIAMFAFLVSVLLLMGCAPKIECAEPNVIIGNECCLDENNNGQCDYSEEPVEVEPIPDSAPETEELVPEEPVPEPEPEPQIREVETEPVPAEQLVRQTDPGKYDIRAGEPRKWIEIDEIAAYRTSRDKGYMDYMVYTVRNFDDEPQRFNVDMMFEYGMNNIGSDARIGKEYTIEELDPGEKVIIKQSLGIFFKGIEESKVLELSLYDPYVSPREDIDDLKKTFTPTEYFPDMEIHTYGLED